MEGELNALMKVTALTASSMAYARLASSAIPPGKFRLLSLLPTIILLPSLPWYFSNFHLRITTVFLLGWLAIFKLLLLAFGLGPLSPSLSLLPFIAVSSLHIKLLRRSPSKSPPSSSASFINIFTYLIIPSALKVLVLAILLSLYQFKFQVPHFLLLSGYCLALYLSMDLILSSSAFVASSLLCLDIGPQFHAPLLSNSLQDFWGRRWNLMASDILRQSVYNPVRSRWGTDAGFLAAFVVSGVMHEVLFYYLTLQRPTGEAFCFFMIHGVCIAVEVKGRRGGWGRPHPAVAVPLVVGFVVVTASSLLFQPILRCGVDEKVVAESAAMMAFFQDGWWAILKWTGAFLH